MSAPDLVSTNEVAERLGVKPMTVHIWRQRHDNFPEPDWVLSSAPIWEWERIEQWARETGRIK